MRLTALILAISIPLLIAISIFLMNRAQSQVAQDASALMGGLNQSIEEALNMWLETNPDAEISATELAILSRLVQNEAIGEDGAAIIVDDQNQLIAHSGEMTWSAFVDMSNYPPVLASRQGTRGSYRFSDENGEMWLANISQLDNGWAVIVQIPESTLSASMRGLQRQTLVAIMTGALIMLVVTWLAVRRAMQPLKELSETASAIAAGDQTRKVVVERKDEVGVLGESIEQMASKMRQLTAELEEETTKRTKDVERSAQQLQVAAEIARQAAAIRDLDGLLEIVVGLISDRFGFYHTAIYLISGAGGGEETADGEPASEEPRYAILRAASSEEGKLMLERRHRLQVGEEGIVGFVARSGRPRIALDVGQDAVFFYNPDLPLTRSEMALPMKSQNRVIGVLDVQSERQAAIKNEDLEILQIIADQVVLAIENIRLVEESQQAYQEFETLYGLQLRQNWSSRLSGKPLIYAFDDTGMRAMDQEPLLGATRYSSGETVNVPIQLRGQRLGTLSLRRDKEMGPWQPQEEELLQEMVSQLALSLENARLLGEIQNRANQEELINQIVAKAQSSLDLDTVMKTVVQEIGRTLNVSRVQIRIGSAPPLAQEVSGDGGSTGRATVAEPLEIPTRPLGKRSNSGQKIASEKHPGAEL
jgi:GAF domain-containing protein/preprotein translocase subunit YajC